MKQTKLFLGLGGLLLAAGQAYDKYNFDTLVLGKPPTILFYAYLATAILFAYITVFHGILGGKK